MKARSSRSAILPIALKYSVLYFAHVYKRSGPFSASIRVRKEAVGRVRFEAGQIDFDGQITVLLGVRRAGSSDIQ